MTQTEGRQSCIYTKRSVVQENAALRRGSLEVDPIFPRNCSVKIYFFCFKLFSAKMWSPNKYKTTITKGLEYKYLQVLFMCTKCTLYMQHVLRRIGGYGENPYIHYTSNPKALPSIFKFQARNQLTCKVNQKKTIHGPPLNHHTEVWLKAWQAENSCIHILEE